jgi:hypothetical protein
MRFIPVLLLVASVLGCSKAKTDGEGPSVANLIADLKSDNPSTRLKAVEELQRKGTEATDAVPALYEALGDRDVAVREMAEVALAQADIAGQLARTNQVTESLHQLGKAMHEYMDANHGFPLAAIPLQQQQGQPPRAGLSWRVQLLPHLGEQNLYKQFKVDEPWDSEHNKKLVEKMPRVFAPPDVPGVTHKPGETYYQVFTSPEGQYAAAFLDPRYYRPGATSRIHVGGFPDGLSNTILIVEGSKPVPWTKPEDVFYRMEEPVPKLGRAVPGRFSVCMADGAVQTFSSRGSIRELRKLIGRHDGEVMDPDLLSPRRAPRPGGERASVRGLVTFRGKPLTMGWVIFHSKDGREFAGVITPEGRYSISDVPVGPAQVTVATRPMQIMTREEHEMYQKAPPLPPQYSTVTMTNLRVEVAKGETTFDFDLK